MGTLYIPSVQTDCVVDLSHTQTIADPVTAFTAAKIGSPTSAPVAMIIHKASQGTGMVDETFAPRRTAARQVDLLFAAYHFCDGSDPKTQVAHFLSVVGDASQTPLALDAEKNSSQVTIAQICTMADAIAQKVGRKLDWLYMGASGPDGAETGMTDAAMAYLASLVSDLWLPEYGTRPICPAPWKTWAMHQYTGDGINGSGTVAGIGKGLDRSYFAGTEDDLRAYVARLLGSAPSAPAPAPQPPVVAPVAPTEPSAFIIPLDTHAHIAAAQAALQQAGLYSGSIDGLAGPKTQAALGAWR